MSDVRRWTGMFAVQERLVLPRPRTSVSGLGALAYAPPTWTGDFHGPTDTLAKMVEVTQGARGEQSIFVRTVLEEIVGQVWPKDYLGEILAVNNWVSEKVVYLNDPLHVELVKDPQRLCEEVRARGWARGDCDDTATLIATFCLQLGRVSQFVVAGFGELGSYTHVFCRVKESRTGKWIVCDPVAGTTVGSMLARIKTYQIWSCDELPSHGPVEVK